MADSVAVQRSFYEVDVFTTTPYFGNALAVVLDGQGLTGDEAVMAAFEENARDLSRVGGN